MVAIADPRRHDASAERFAHELELIASAGWTVGVLPLASRLRGAPPHSDRLRRTFAMDGVTLLRPDSEVSAQLLLVRDLEVFCQVQEVSPDLTVDRAVAIIEAPALMGEATDGTATDPSDVAISLADVQEKLRAPWSLRPTDALTSAELASLPGLSPNEEWPSAELDPDGYLATIRSLLTQAAAGSTTAAEGALADTSSTELHARLCTTGPAAWHIGRQRSAGSPRARVALISDNGHGLGHITRLMAIARKFPGHVAPVFFTLSESYPLVQRAGFPVEYFPSRHRFGIEPERWEALLRIRFDRFLQQIRPNVLVIDHGDPPRAIVETASDAGVAVVWSRRGLWREGRGHDSLDRRTGFDLVIEPGDLAAPLDRGATRHRSAQRVRPITLVDQEDLLSPTEARAELGLPPDGMALLLQLAADDTRAFAQLTRTASTQLRRAGITVFAPRHPLHPAATLAEDGLLSSSVYPVARYLAAFDAAVSMSGYNSFHELILAAVPTVFIARPTDTIDDQSARARYAEFAGAALHAPTVDDGLIDQVATLLDPLEGPRFCAAARQLHPGNGAADAAELIGRLADRFAP